MAACWAHNPEVGRSKLPLVNFFQRISIGEDIETITSQVNERESGKIYTTLSHKNHNTRYRVLKIPNTSRMAQWKRAGPLNQRSVDRNYLLLIVSKDFSERGNQNTYITNQQKRIRRNLHFIAYEPQYKIKSSHNIVTPAGWRSGSVLGP